MKWENKIQKRFQKLLGYNGVIRKSLCQCITTFCPLEIDNYKFKITSLLFKTNDQLVITTRYLLDIYRLDIYCTNQSMTVYIDQNLDDIVQNPRYLLYKSKYNCLYIDQNLDNIRCIVTF